MTTQTQKPLVLTVDEFFDKNLPLNLLDPILFLAYHTIDEVKKLVDDSDLDSGGYAFADIKELGEKLYNRIRIMLTLVDDNNVEIQTHLAEEE
ncbi:hypothetical protein [Moraxella lacunata]|uniref:hypothetical protein n=1 Tax=Moraxella lacunata TaxID=477 RepID=UPI003EE3EF62